MYRLPVRIYLYHQDATDVPSISASPRHSHVVKLWWIHCSFAAEDVLCYILCVSPFLFTSCFFLSLDIFLCYDIMVSVLQ